MYECSSPFASSDDHLAGLLGVLDGGLAGYLGHLRDPLRLARLEQLHDARKAVRDVGACDTSGVEGPHGQLGAGLTDRLRGDDADRVAEVAHGAGGERHAVAGAANPASASH